MRIAIGADNLGFSLKESIKEHLETQGHEVVDYGVHDTAPVDYPDIAGEVSRDVPGVRAAAVSDPYSAERARKSNNAQVLCLGARVVGPAVAEILVDHWLTSEFQGGDSARKVAKIDALETVCGPDPRP
jgi:ribose 5-phosphate isomerase B